MDYIDLRSDTVTKPTSAMRKAMAEAKVGDDVYGEDPTVNILEKMAAELMGKESALFVPSGTMGNLTAVLTHCNRGDEVIMGNKGHTFLFEGGGIAALGGVHPFTLQNQEDGTIDIEDIRMSIRMDDPHFPKSRLIILENTHNRCGGVVLPIEYIKGVGDVAQQSGLLMHLDGARIFNAVVFHKTNASYLAECADSVTFCLSKGLCAPIGSILCGSNDFIYKARRIRKQLGGGMRQAGILAAAGIVALESMVERLDDDHKRARILEEELNNIPWLRIIKKPLSTNMIFADLVDDIKFQSKEICQKLRNKNILIGSIGLRSFRMVTHYWIDDGSVQKTINGFRDLV